MCVVRDRFFSRLEKGAIVNRDKQGAFHILHLDLGRSGGNTRDNTSAMSMRSSFVAERWGTGDGGGQCEREQQ